MPVIASLNGTTAEAWLTYAQLIQQAGADALEVNFYEVVTELALPAVAIETEIVTAITELKRLLRIPVAVKLSPFFTAFGNMASRLDQAGVDGLVMFNRFYQPDIDINTMTATPTIELSRSAGAPAPAALARDSSWSRAAIARRHRRRRDLERWRQSHPGRGSCGADGVGAPSSRSRILDHDAREAGGMDGVAEGVVGRGDARACQSQCGGGHRRL